MQHMKVLEAVCIWDALGHYGEEGQSLWFLIWVWWKLVIRVTLEIDHVFSIYLYGTKWKKEGFICFKCSVLFSLYIMGALMSIRSVSWPSWFLPAALHWVGEADSVPVRPGSWSVPQFVTLPLFGFGTGNSIWIENFGESQQIPESCQEG